MRYPRYHKVFEQLIIKVQGATTVCSSPLLRSFVIEGRDILLSHPVSINKISKYMTNFSDHFIETRRLAFFNRVEQSKWWFFAKNASLLKLSRLIHYFLYWGFCNFQKKRINMSFYYLIFNFSTVPTVLCIKSGSF